MAQKALREYDAKQMRYTYTDSIFPCYSLGEGSSLQTIQHLLPPDASRVIKPDQLFGKRGKYGLVGVNLSTPELLTWLEGHRGKLQHIDGCSGRLDTFLIEPYIPHTQEWYLAIHTQRDGDIIHFSAAGGGDIEAQRGQVTDCTISPLKELTVEKITADLGEMPTVIRTTILQLYQFFRTHGFTYLETNPLTIDASGEVVCLDMVAKVDTCEAGKQKERWKHITRVKPFGSSTHPLETQIEQMDAKTGASLKFSTLHTEGSIGLILGGGGASVVVMDTLAERGLLAQVINYGELSGNPNYWDNKTYIQGVIDLMCEHTPPQQRLCLIGGIANFTRIDILAKAFVDALAERVEEIHKHHIHICVRRGGVNDKKGLALIETFCVAHDIPHTIADGDTYLTDPVRALQA